LVALLIINIKYNEKFFSASQLLSFSDSQILSFSASQLLSFPNSQIPSFIEKTRTFVPILLLFVTISSANAREWISFGTSREPKAPEIILISSTNTQLVYSVETFGFYSSEITQNGTVYQKIEMPEVVNNNRPGYPALPLMNKPVCYSGKVFPTVSVDVTQQLVLNNYMVYPAPMLHDSVMTGGIPYIAELFFLDPHIYGQNTIYPLDVTGIVSQSQFRDQKYVNVVTNPLRWNPTTKVLNATVKCTVTVNLGNDPSTPSELMGIFSQTASELFMNYPKSSKLKSSDFQKDEKSSGVQYYTLTNWEDAKLINADYLIITDQQFFEPNNPNSELRRIAAHRANYNGFKVAVLSAQNIMSDAVGFEYIRFNEQFGDDIKYKGERRLKACIKTIYDNGLAPHTYDEHTAFVLLVGDAVQDYSGSIPATGIPASHDPYDIWETGQDGDPTVSRNYYVFPTDYNYSTMTLKQVGNTVLSVYDDIGDLYIGRFCVNNFTELQHMIDKTINYETGGDPDGWKEKSFFFNCANLSGDTKTYIEEGWFGQFIPYQIKAPYSFDIRDMDDYSTGEMIAQVMTFLNRGQAYTSYYGHSKINEISIGGELGVSISTDYLKQFLNNESKYGFLYLHSCQAGNYDQLGLQCLAEELTRYSSNKGFVGILASSGSISLDNSTYNYCTPQTMQEYMLDESQSKLAHLMGEYSLNSKILNQNEIPTKTASFSIILNLFGDPATNLRSQGFSVSKYTILHEKTTISDEVHVLSGVTLTLKPDCHVYFGNRGRLIIDNGATINFDNIGSFNFHGMELTNALEINGNVITNVIKPTINFDAPDIPEEMSCSGLVFDNPALDVTFGTINLTRSALIANSLNSLTIQTPGTSWSNIIKSPVILNCKNVNIRRCNFSDGANLSCYRPNNDGIYLKIENSTFTPFNTQPTNQQDMVFVGGYNTYDIQGNIINFNSGDGLSLYKSGAGDTRIIKNNTINFTGPTYYQNNGIKLYQSSSVIETNTITNAKYGISTFSNTGKIVDLKGNSQATQPSQTQQVMNNTENQLFSADAASFPSPVKYNYFDNTTNKPLVYCSGSNIPANSLNVKCNNWGTGFMPSQDLYPFAAYSYLPVWNFNGFCTGKSLTTENLDSLSIDDAINFFRNIPPENESEYRQLTISLSELAEKMKSNNERISQLQLLLSDIAQNQANNILGETAKTLKNQLYINMGEYSIPINEAEYKLSNPGSLADSVYAAIELANIFLECRNESVSSSNTCSSAYLPLLPSNYDAFRQYKTHLTDQLYPKPSDFSDPLPENEPEIQFTISPNPAQDFISIALSHSDSTPITIQLIEETGKVVLSHAGSYTSPIDEMELDISNIASGYYFLRLTTVNKIIGTKPIVIIK